MRAVEITTMMGNAIMEPIIATICFVVFAFGLGLLWKMLD